MKRIILMAALVFSVSACFAQTDEITQKNSWLKAGISAGVPVGDIHNFSSFTAGLELAGQWMATNHFGVGISSGYTHFFPKNNGEGFGVIPVGLLLRYYPQAAGIFVGTDVGYSILTNTNGSSGGFYVKPQVGYHNYSWNFYGFYNQVFRGTGVDIQNAGIAAVYNLRFNKR